MKTIHIILEIVVSICAILSFIWVLCVGIPEYSYEKKCRKFSYDFELRDIFPVYGEEVKEKNGQWIEVPYVFTNVNDYSVCYQVLWQFWAEDEKGDFSRLAPNFNYNAPYYVALKNRTSENVIKTLLGRPQIDDIKENHRKIRICVYLKIWDKQEVLKEGERPKYVYPYVFDGYFTAEDKYQWDCVSCVLAKNE